MKSRVRSKPQIAASLPKHIAEEIQRFSTALDITKGEYLALIARKWYADNCPPVSDEEKRLRETADHPKQVKKPA
ncbi:MAG: hypothetical protein QM715_15515 [Nibricoccus sp.]